MNRSPISLFKPGFVATFSALVLACGMVAQAQTPVDPRTMVDMNATALVDVGSSMGMYNWSISGQDQLQQQWFWYRVGATGPQFSIDTIGAPAVSQPVPNQLITTYTSGGSFSLEVGYVLHGYGSGVSDIDEAITIQNLSGGVLDFYFYQYSDFNLGSVDLLDMDNSYAFQQSGLNAIAEGIIDPASTYFEANTTGWSGSTLTRLTTQDDVMLNGTDHAEGDVTWAYEWYFQIGVGQSASIIKDKALTITLIPEPSAFAIMALGLGAWLLPRRRNVF